MANRKYASEEEKWQHWQEILVKNADNYRSELSKEYSEETGIKLYNNEKQASNIELFNPERARLIFNHIERIGTLCKSTN